MSKRFATPAVVILAFAVAPLVAIAGDGESSSGEKADRVAELQGQVDPFVTRVRDAKIDVSATDVEAITNGRSMARRGRRLSIGVVDARR